MGLLIRRFLTDTLQIIDRINSFYSQAFSQLVAYTVGLLAFAGIVIPLLIQFIQNRSLRIEKESLEALITIRLGEVKANLLATIAERFQTETKSLEEVLNKKVEESSISIARQLAEAKGGLFHLQGNSRETAGAYALAAQDYCKAAEYYFDSTAEVHLQTALRNIINLALPNMNHEDFKDNQDLDGSFTALLKLLVSNNQTGRYTLILKDIKDGINEAKKRAKAR